MDRPTRPSKPPMAAICAMQPLGMDSEIALIPYGRLHIDSSIRGGLKSLPI